MRLRLAIQRHLFDVAALVTVVGALLEIWLSSDVEGSEPGLTAFTLVWGALFLARRRAPVLAPSAVIVVVCVQSLIWPHSVPYMAGTFVMVLFVAGHLGATLTSRRGRIAGTGLLLGAVLLVVFIDPEGNWTNLVGTIPFVGFAWLVGQVYRSNTDRTAELRERAERLEREHDAEARAAVAEERTRIAREMHDVVAHSLSVMVVQAEAAEEMIGIDPERARLPLIAVQDTGRAALGELRRMLGVLREKDESGVALAPQPGLAGLDELVDHVRAAGLPVRMRVEGDPRPLPSGIDLSAYRIVQEGLTNSLKHAGPASAEVLVRYGQGEIELRVSDDGRGHDPASNGEGHGLVGMRERVALYGGELQAGPGPRGGYTLSARMPLDASRSA